MSSVFKVFSAPVKWIGDAVSSVVDFAVDNILEPVIDIVSGVVEGMMDDPITTIAMIAAMVTGQVWAIPLIAGVSTAVQGGDIMDIAIAVAASYAGAQAGAVVGKYVGSAITNEALSAIASEAASGATKSIIMAAATGGDIKRAAFTGAASGAISAGIGEVGTYLSETYGTIDPVKLTDGFTWDETSFVETSSSIGLELSDIIDGYESLPEIVKDIIAGTATSTIETFVTTGNAPNEEQLASIMTNAAITGNAAVGFFEDNLDMDAKVAAQTTKIIGDVVKSAYAGADPYDAYKTSLTSTFQQDLNEEINNITGGGIAQAIDQITGRAEEYQSAVTTLNNSTTAVNEKGNAVNDKVAEAQALLDGKTDIPGLGKYGRADWEADAEIATGALGEEARARQGKWNAAYTVKRDQLNALQASYQGLLAVYEGDRKDFAAAQDNVFTAQQYLDEASEPTVRVAQAAVVKALVRDFNPDEYREIHGLTGQSDPYQHWLNNDRKLAINQDDYNQRINSGIRQNSELNKLINQFSDGAVKYKNIQELWERISGELQHAYLYSPEGVISERGAGIAYEAAQAHIEEYYSSEEYKQNLTKKASLSEKDRVYYSENVTAADVLNGKATFVIENFNEIIRGSGLGQLDPRGEEYLDQLSIIRFTKMPQMRTYFDPRLNREVTSFFDVDSGTALLIDAKTKQPFAAYTGGIIADNGQVYWPSQDIDKFKKLGIEVPPADSGAETWEQWTEEIFINPVFWEHLEPQWLDSAYAKNTLEKAQNTIQDPERQANFVISYNNALRLMDAQGGYTEKSGISPENPYGMFRASEKHPAPPLLSVQEIAGIVPIAVMDAAQSITLDSTEYNNLGWFAKRVVDLGEGVKEASDWLGENKEAVEEWGIDVDQLQKNAGLAVGAGAELISAFNGITTFFANDRFKYTDARTTDMGRAAKALALLATASQPEDYNEAVKSVMASFGEQEGFVDSSLFIINTLFGDDPVARDVAWREIIAKEVLQEAVLLVGSVGTGTVVKNAAKGLAWAGSKAAGKDAVERATIEFTKKMGGGAAWATNAGLQVLETTGAQGAEAYAEIFGELIKAGYTQEAANAEAGKQAVVVGVTSGLIEAVAGRVLDQGDLLSRSIVGETAARYASKNLAKKALGIVAEGLSEAAEETAAIALRVNALRNLVPDSDLFAEGGKYHPDKIGNTYGVAATWGALAGIGTAASITAASALYNDSTGEEQPPPPPDSPQGGIRYKPYNTGNTSANALINLNPNVYNTVNGAADSEDPEVKARAEDDIKTFFGYDPTTPFDGTTVDVTQDPDGVFRFNTAVDILNVANPDAYHTYNDVSTAFSNNEAQSQIGFVPTKQDIQTFIGGRPPPPPPPPSAPSAGEVIPYVRQDEVVTGVLPDLQTNVDDYINANFTTPSEVSVRFGELGYSPTEEEVGQFTGQGPQTERIGSIAPYVDPRQTTADEILDYFESLGYTPEEAETALFTGQGDPDFEATQLPTIDPYVDPRQVTRSEAEAYFRAQGYTPTEDEITRFITQANDPTFQATQEQKLTEEFDPLAVLPEEARQAYETAGFFDALDPDIERLTGQYPESELESRVQDALPVATYNSIANMLGKPGQEVTQADVSFVADIIAQNEVGQELADTASPAPLSQEQLMYDVTGDNIIDIADQTMLEQIIAGTVPQTDIASDSAFAATGVQGQLQQQTQLQTQMQTQIQTQIQEDERRRTAQREQQYMQSLLETSPVKVETPDAKPIEYMYDPFGESIFATPKQEQMFGAATPYAAKGGLVKNTTDEILEIMRGR